MNQHDYNTSKAIGRGESKMIFSSNHWRAPRWKIWCARIFGKKQTTYADGFRLTTYTWRGVIYITRYQ